MNRKTKAPNKDQLPDLETSLTEINTLISHMEQGEQNLEQSLEQFERGIHLIKHCQKILQDAENKVLILIQNNAQDTLQPYENNQE